MVGGGGGGVLCGSAPCSLGLRSRPVWLALKGNFFQPQVSLSGHVFSVTANVCVGVSVWVCLCMSLCMSVGVGGLDPFDLLLLILFAVSFFFISCWCSLSL